MAVFRVIDDYIVTEAEFRARRNELADFFQSQLDAALKNIVTDALKPKTTS